ncbi:MAG: ATPase [Cyanothece sp. SIO1E1]|nr:ATPase [Cyanothece sp. SIO1E1]
MTVSRTVCLGFLAVITLGTLLLMLPFSTSNGSWNPPIVALFTATSAVCVTGLAVVDTGTYFSPLGQFFILLLIQVGGLGYMTATTFLLLILGRRLGLRDRLAVQQSLDKSGLSDIRSLVRSIISTTLIFQLTGVFLLLWVFTPDYGMGQGLWLSIFHSVSAFNNAGFSLFSDSLTQYVRSPLLNLVITALIISGGIGYQVIMELYMWLCDRCRRCQEFVVFSLHFKIVTSTTALLLAIGTIAFLFTEFNNPATLASSSLSDKILAAWFHSVTTRTAGFNNIDIGSMTRVSLFITIALMFVGASPGSTGGGIKTTTIRILLSCTKAVLQGKEEVLCYQRQIPVSRILKAIGVVVGSATTVVGVTTLIALTDPQLSFIQILFEAVSAFATVGLSTGITAQLSILAKLILIPTMYVGRVGVLILMAAVLGDPKPSVVHYPEEELLVG